MSLETSVPSPLVPASLPADRLVAGADAALIGLFETDLATGVSTWSDAVYTLLGCRRGDVPATLDAWRGRVHPDDLVAMRAAYAAALEGDGLYAATYRVRRLDTGDYRWIDARGRIVRGATDRFIGVVVDVTERRGEVAALRDSEARFRQLVEVAPALMWVGDPAGRQMYVNGRWREYTGLAFEDPGDWMRTVHPDDAHWSWAAWSDAIARAEPFEMELRLREGSTGRYRWFRSAGAPLRDADGRVERWVGVVTDVHERRAAAERAEALQRVTAALSAAATHGEVARVVSGLAVRFMDARSGTLALRTDLGPRAPGGAFVELVESPSVLPAWRRLPLDAELPVTVSIREGRALLFESREQMLARFPDVAAYVAEVRDIEAFLVAPLRVGGEVVGAVAFTHAGRRVVDGQAIAQLEALARLVADALERVRLVDALRRELGERAQAEREFRMLAETVPDLVFTTTPDGRLEWYNSRTAEFCGRPWSPDAPDLWRMDVHPDDVAAVAASWQRAMETGEPYESEARWRRARDGAWRWMLNRALPLRDDAGRISLWVGTGTDVHERRAAADRAEALQRVTAALGAAVDVTEVSRVLVREAGAALDAGVAGLWLPAADGTALERVESLALSADTSRRWTRLPLDAAAPVTEAFRTGRLVAVAGDEEVGRFPLLAESFAREGFRAAIALPLVVDGRPLGVLTMGFREARVLGADERLLLDSLARQAALAVERAHLYDAERRAHAAAERARAEAEAASRAKSEFLAIMSHELRTPLNAIAGHVELLEMGIHGELSARQLDALDRVARAQRHLLALINDVLNLSRIESGRVEYAISPVDLRDVVHAVAPLIEPQLAARQLTYEVHLPDVPLLVRADPDKLQQVLLNLLANAVKYTEPGGRVTVDTATREGSGPVAFVRVADTGCGIAREKLDHVFEPFVRVDSAHTRRTDGAGLGLAIARDLARGMGGELRARSVVGEGSTFTVTLPLA